MAVTITHCSGSLPDAASTPQEMSTGSVGSSGTKPTRNTSPNAAVTLSGTLMSTVNILRPRVMPDHMDSSGTRQRPDSCRMFGHTGHNVRTGEGPTDLHIDQWIAAIPPLAVYVTIGLIVMI